MLENLSWNKTGLELHDDANETVSLFGICVDVPLNRLQFPSFLFLFSPTEVKGADSILEPRGSLGDTSGNIIRVSVFEPVRITACRVPVLPSQGTLKK